MRRAAALVALPLLAAVAVAGCSSSSSAKSSPSTATANSVVTATGSFGAAPKVTIPAEKAAPALFTKTVIQGSGTKLTTAQTLEGNFVLYDWSGTTHKLLGSTYGSGGPTLFAGQMIPGLETALIGQKLGSRVLAVIPPKEAFGTSGNSSDRRQGHGHAGLRHRPGQVVQQHRRRAWHADLQRRRRAADRDHGHGQGAGHHDPGQLPAEDPPRSRP